MKIVVYGPQHRLGALSGDRVIDLARADANLPSELGAFIAGGPPMLAAAERAVAAAQQREPDGETVVALQATRLHAPQVRGARIVCAGGNFADHTAAMARKRNDVANFPTDLAEITAAMRARGIWGFWKLGRDAAGPGDEIVYPARTQRLDYEGELAIILGTGGKDKTVADLPAMVWGVTLFNDVSIRDTREAGGGPLNFATQKNFDGSYAMGPCIVVGEGIDWEDTPVETLVNGEVRQSYSTRDMVVKFGEYLEWLSRDFTFHPGDVFTGGTAAGTAADSSEIKDGVFAPERFLKPGDTMEVRSPKIGSLVNRIVAKAS